MRRLRLYWLFIIGVIIFSCQKEEVELPSGDYKPPILTKPTIVNVYPTAVELNAEFEYIGQEPIGHLAFQIGKKEDFDTSSTDQIRYLDSIPTDTTPFNIQITGLDAATTYLVKSLAKNTNGKIFRSFESLEFTTPDYSLPAIKTIDDENNFIAYGTSARLTGEIVSKGGLEITEYGYTFSDQTNLPTTENGVVLGSTTENSLLFDYALRPLVPNTTYYVRTFAINDKGTSYGLAYEFNSGALRELPELSLETVRALDFERIELKAEVLFEGSSSINEHGFVWSANEPLPTLENYFVKLGSEVGDFAAVAENLNPETFYSFRAFAVNDSGITYTDVLKTKTLVNKALPGVRDLEVNLKNGVELNIEANFFRIGDENILKHGFEISKSDDFTNQGETISLGALTEAKIQNGQFTGEPGTEYFVRAFAMNTKDTVYSETVSKTTNQDSRLPSVISFTKSAAGTDFIDLEYELNFGSKYNTFTNASINIYSGNQVNSNSFIRSVSISKNKTENTKRIYGLSTSSEYSFKIELTNPDGKADSELFSLNTLRDDFLELSNLKYRGPVKYDVSLGITDQNLPQGSIKGVSAYSTKNKLLDERTTSQNTVTVSLPYFDKKYRLEGFININDTVLKSGAIKFNVPKPIPDVTIDFKRSPLDYENVNFSSAKMFRLFEANHTINNDTFGLNGEVNNTYFKYDTTQYFRNNWTAGYITSANKIGLPTLVGYKELFVQVEYSNDSITEYITDTINIQKVGKVKKLGEFQNNYGYNNDYGCFQSYGPKLFLFGSEGVAIFDTSNSKITSKAIPSYTKRISGEVRVYLNNSVFYLGQTVYSNNSWLYDSVYLFNMKNEEWGASKGIEGPAKSFGSKSLDGISKGSSFYLLYYDNSDFYLTKYGSNGKWTNPTKMNNYSPPNGRRRGHIYGEVYFEDGISDHWATWFGAFDFGSQDYDFAHLNPFMGYNIKSNLVEFKGDYYFTASINTSSSTDLRKESVVLIKMYKDGSDYDIEIVKVINVGLQHWYLTTAGNNIYGLGSETETSLFNGKDHNIYRIFYKK
ncbi:MAG: hypothetical protein JXQ87_11320 [Bacteroidia bacterium]